METKDVLIVEDIERVRKVSKESYNTIIEETYKITLDKLRKAVLEAARSGRTYLYYNFESYAEVECKDRLKEYFETYGYAFTVVSNSDTISISW